MNIRKTYHTLILTIVVLWIGGFSVKAQQDSTKASNHTINLLFQPLFIGNKAIKLDLEFQRSQSRFAYVITPELYSGIISDTETSKNASEDRINGFGIGIQQKLKFKKEPVSHYFSYGLTYRYNKITYDSEGFIPYQENGLNYYDYGPYKNDMKINSILLSGVLGFQESYWDILLADLYLGFGYKLPDVKIDNPGVRQYSKYFTSPAYKGVLLLAGIKIGVQIKK